MDDIKGAGNFPPAGERKSEATKNIENGYFKEFEENVPKQHSPFDDLGEFIHSNSDAVEAVGIVPPLEEIKKQKNKTERLLSGEIKKISETKGYFKAA